MVALQVPEDEGLFILLYGRFDAGRRVKLTVVIEFRGQEFSRLMRGIVCPNPHIVALALPAIKAVVVCHVIISQPDNQTGDFSPASDYG